MTGSDRLVIGGVDAHTDSHDAAALNERGRLLATQTFATTSQGYCELLAWLKQFGSIAMIGIEWKVTSVEVV